MGGLPADFLAPPPTPPTCKKKESPGYANFFDIHKTIATAKKTPATRCKPKTGQMKRIFLIFQSVAFQPLFFHFSLLHNCWSNKMCDLRLQPWLRSPYFGHGKGTEQNPNHQGPRNPPKTAQTSTVTKTEETW